MIYYNCWLFPMDGPDIQRGYLETAGGKIRKIGRMEELPSLPSGVDCRGKKVYPGFIDAHCHLGIWEDSLGFEGADGNEETDPCTPHLRAVDAVNVQERCFEEALSAGVTTVMTGPGSANPIAGQFCAVKTYGRCIDDMLIREPAAMKFALGENPKTVYNDKAQAPTTRMATAAIIREQLYKAQRYLRDMERAEEDEDTDEPEYDAKCEALIPLLRGEIPAHVHAHRADDIFTALRIAREFDLRCVIVHGTGGHEVADLLAQRGAKIIAGPMLGTRSKPELKSMSQEGPALLAEAGLPVAICTDHPEMPVEQLALSAAICHRHGMPYETALKAITLTAATLCEIDDRVGSLTPGKDADILFYAPDTDPLSLGTRPLAVMVDGKIVVGSL